MRHGDFLTGAPLLAAFDAQSVRYIVCAGLVAITCCLLVLARTQWGHSNPLRKCIVLSLVAHLLIGIYATTVQIVSNEPPGGAATSIVLVDGSGDDLTGAAEPAAASGDDLSPNLAPESGEPGLDETNPKAARDAATRASAPSAAAPPIVSNETPSGAPESEPISSVLNESAAPAEAAPISSPAATAADIPPPEPATNPAKENSPKEPPAAQAASASEASTPAASSAHTPAEKTPDTDPKSNALAGAAPIARSAPAIYSLRTASDHVRVAEQHGGNEQTEAAVGAALQYLVANQSIDGRWNPRALEAGRQQRSDGPDRHGVGMQADTGLTGLCLLSLLAAGHTHLNGEYAASVKHGLEFLLGAQTADGSLAGAATLYERMYCHGMASFALSEALAMTGDERLRPAVEAAIGYTLHAQNATSGGWRYQPGEPGDMSQFGWQAMAIKSAALGGVAIPDESRNAMRQFLRGVSSGRHAGLAAYRPGHPPTRAMTAEALVCRQFVGIAPDDPQSREAGDFVMTELPGEGPANVYYWYYGTLGMYQLQGVYWQRWNTALQKQLLNTQRREGKLAGSWNPDPVWGGYGGRAFSTALSALCLEVYYRFLPLYAAHAESGRSMQ